MSSEAPALSQLIIAFTPTRLGRLISPACSVERYFQNKDGCRQLFFLAREVSTFRSAEIFCSDLSPIHSFCPVVWTILIGTRLISRLLPQLTPSMFHH